MIQEYLNYQEKRKGLSANTLTAYRKDLHKWVTWAQKNGLRWSTTTKQDLDAWLTDMHDRSINASTINRCISSVRGLFTWAHHEGILKDNPARYLQAHRKRETLPQVVKVDDIETYLSKPCKSHDSAIGHALIALLRDTGLRLQEAIDLKLADFDTTEQSITVRSGKGSKERKVFYTHRTVEHCVRIAGRYAPYLLPRWEQRDYRQVVARELGTHPHALRHTFATNLLNNGADLKVVSHLLGHASVKTTERYAKVTNTTAQNQYNKFN